MEDLEGEETSLLAEKPMKEVPREPLAGFLFIGFAANLAFNYLLQEVKFFNDVFGEAFGRRASFFFAFSNLIGQLLMLFYGSWVPHIIKIPVSCGILALSLVVIPALTWWAIPFKLNMVLGLVFVMGLMTAVILSSGFTLTSLCSPRVRLFYTLGTCVAGITGWVTIRVVELALVYGFDMSMKRNREDGGPTRAEFIQCGIVIVSGSACLIAAMIYYIFSLSKSQAVVQALCAGKKKGGVVDKKTAFWETVIASMPMALAGANIMLVTFIVLPDQMTPWRPSFGFWGNSPNLYQESVIFGFNLFDVIGRLLAIWAIRLNSVQVMAGSFSRWLILPCFFLASRHMSIFANDITKFVLLVVFGGSYGLILTWAFTLAPSQPGIKPENAEIAGALASFMVTFGIVLGTLVAAGVPTCLSYLHFAPYEITCTIGDPEMLVCQESVLLNPPSGSPVT